MANGFEQAARAKKTLALVGEIDRQALKQGKNPHDQAAVVLLASYSWGPEVWQALATRAGVSPPSEATKAAVRDVYRGRATADLENRRAS